MATITGKRFQITDGASTPTNLFPYTVSEAVYGLSNTISNAISTALSALSLSTYAGTSAIGSSTQPVYYNGSALVATDLSTTYAPYNANGYLPLTGGTLTGKLTMSARIDMDNNVIEMGSGMLGAYSPDNPRTLYWYNGSGWQTVWHSGNSNLSTVAWACSTLTASGTIVSSANPGFRVNATANATALSAYVNGNRKWQIDTIDGDARWYSDGAGAYVLNIATNGNIGIGTGATTPTYKLDVNGSIGCTTLTASGMISASHYNGSYLVASNVMYVGTASDALGSSYTGGCFFAYGTNPLYFTTNSAVRMTITGSGNVGFGTTSPAQKLDLRGNFISVGTNAGYILYPGMASGEALRIATCNTSAVWQANAIYVLTNGKVGFGMSTPSERVHVSGNILATGAITAGSSSSSSDARLKANIKDFSYTSDLLLALKPREWDWNEYSHLEGHSAGIVAQEIQGLMPYAVGSVSDEKFGEHLTMNYDTLHALEIAGLQDHESRIRQLEAENRELRKRLNMN